jgi:alpha-D-ribose 1-methylphosphonate 5-triphosphate synthase subunit PhnH
MNPERGATIVYCAAGARTPAALSGPGVDGVWRVELPVDRHELEGLLLAGSAPPAGVDVLAIADRSVLALPRSTTIVIGG